MIKMIKYEQVCIRELPVTTVQSMLLTLSNFH